MPRCYGPKCDRFMTSSAGTALVTLGPECSQDDERIIPRMVVGSHRVDRIVAPVWGAHAALDAVYLTRTDDSNVGPATRSIG